MITNQYPPMTATHKPTHARHMFGDAMMLENLRDVKPVDIKVANAHKYYRITASRMRTTRLHAFNLDGTPTYIDVPNVLYSPSLPANLVFITQLYTSGFKTVDPHYGGKTDDLNLYFSESRYIVPAYKDEGTGRRVLEEISLL